MHIKSYGAGPKVVLALHGWGGDHREFAPVAARRPRDGRILSPDLPGYGRSPVPPAWTPEGILAPLVDAMDRLALGPIPVAGFCSGAFPALLLARDYSRFVSRLILIDPFFRVPLYFRLFTWGWFGRRAYQATFHGAVGRALTNGILRKRQASESDFTGAFKRLDSERVLRYLKLFVARGYGADFAGLRMPIDLVYGEKTFHAVRTSIRLYAGQWPAASIHRLPGVGHLPLVQGAGPLATLLWPEESSG
jgi:pimeloyl-ACP methyl ester carboxylesterase